MDPRLTVHGRRLLVQRPVDDWCSLRAAGPGVPTLAL